MLACAHPAFDGPVILFQMSASESSAISSDATRSAAKEGYGNHQRNK
jgi:hypothetical protein